MADVAPRLGDAILDGVTMIASAPLRVLFFGPVRERLDTAAIDIPCADPVTPDALWSLLLARFPGLEPLRSSIRLARNGEFLVEGATLYPGDEIALIPPVSGG